MKPVYIHTVSAALSVPARVRNFKDYPGNGICICVSFHGESWLVVSRAPARVSASSYGRFRVARTTTTTSGRKRSLFLLCTCADVYIYKGEVFCEVGWLSGSRERKSEF